jgi:hypothetical protein
MKPNGSKAKDYLVLLQAVRELAALIIRIIGTQRSTKLQQLRLHWSDLLELRIWLTIIGSCLAVPDIG